MSNPRPPIKRALLVGIDYKGTPAQLNGCVNDIKNIRNILNTKYGYVPNQIRMLTDDTIKPTIANIMSSINRLLLGIQSGDTLLFYFSGHGTSFTDTSNDELDKKDEGIVPFDYNRGIITDDWLHNNLIKRIPTGVTLYCFFDCCHSGSMCDLKYNIKCTRTYTGLKNELITEYVPSKWLNKFNIDIEGTNDTVGNVYMFSACQDSQLASETVINNQPQGAFTNQFISFLNNNVNNKIPLSDVLKEIDCNLVIKGFKEQSSQLSLGRIELFSHNFSI